MSKAYSNKVLAYISCGLSSFAVVIASQMPRADAINFTGSSGTNLAASADFQLNGDTLTLRLTNTSSNDVSAPADLLTGIFFNASKSLNLQSATLGLGSSVYKNGSTVGTQSQNVSVATLDGGWQYNSNISDSNSTGINQGIGTAGFGIFNGKLTGNGNQFDYGILSASSNLTANANDPVQNTSLIQNSILFTFTGASGLNESSFSNVLFQYGTSLSEAHFAGSTLADATAALDKATAAVTTTAKDVADKTAAETAAKQAVEKAATETATADTAAKAAKAADDKAVADKAVADKAAATTKDAADKAAKDAVDKANAKDAADKAAKDAATAKENADKEKDAAKDKAAKTTGKDKKAAEVDAADKEKAANNAAAAKDTADKAAQDAADKAKAAKDTADKAAQDAADKAKVAKDTADKAGVTKASAEKAAQDLADKQAVEKATVDKATKASAEKASAEVAVKEAKEAADKVAKEKADKEAADKVAKEKADKEAADKVAKEKADQEAADKVAKEKADKEAADKVAKEKADQEAADKSPISTRPLPIINFNLSDVGKTFQFNFDGSVDTQNITGLTSTGFFTLKSFNGTEAAFDVNLDNTSSAGIKSRTSGLGFNVYSDLKSTNKLDLASEKTSASGLFTNSVLDGAFPNQFGAIDVCFTEGNTCQGGQNGGIKTDDGIGKFSFNLAFNKTVDSFALGNLGVRYQSIEGTSLGTSGTGQGKFYQAPPVPPKKVPEPSTTAALGLFAIGALKALKKKL